MKLKKNYTYKSKRQIWRIIPTDTGRLIIEERESEKKQVYFNCLQTNTGKKIFKDFQLEEKFWVGIEAVYEDYIFFHKYLKPDMPGHKGIIALEIRNKKIRWKNNDLVFLFPSNGLIYTYAQMFEGRNHFSLDYKTGKIIEDLGTDSSKINVLREKYIERENNKDYLFPDYYFENNNFSEELNAFIRRLKDESAISGKIEFIQIDSFLFFSYHSVNSKDSLDNFFKVVDLSKGNYILEDILNEEIRLFVADSFFIKGNLLFVLFGKSKLNVYEIRK